MKKNHGPTREVIEEWLASIGMAESHDPNVLLIRRSAVHIDDLDGDDLEMEDAKRLVQVEKAEKLLANARKALQEEVERADSETKRKRHQLRYGGMAAQSLGYIDGALLSEALRAKVAKELWEVHEIDLATYEPTKEEGP